MSKEMINLADELHEFVAAAPYEYPGHLIGLFERASTALRASAVAEPVAWSAEAGPVPIGNRAALRAWLCTALLMIQEDVPHEEDRAVIGYAAHEIASLPAPEAAPTREELTTEAIREILRAHIFASRHYEIRGLDEAANAILALKAAPAK